MFESLDDAEVRTAGTTYLIYRGRHDHEVAQDSALARIVTSTLFRRTIKGPLELFYSDLYASRRTGCRGQMGLPGARDQHTGCVGSYLVEHDLFDFLLFSLPDNDAYSHRNGPHAQVTSLAAADRQIERLMHAGGGPDQFLEEHAVIVCSDHSQARGRGVDPPGPRVRRLRRGDAERARRPARRRGRAQPRPALGDDLRAGRRRSRGHRRTARWRRSRDLEGVDLTMWMDGEEAVIRGHRGELRFAPGGDVQDAARPRLGRRRRRCRCCAPRSRTAACSSTEYPDALTRVWSALHCENAGEILLSAAPGYEFVDWGGADHVGGGSHGSLHRSDSFATLLWCG